MSNQQSDVKSELNGLTHTVSNAGSECHQVGTGGGGIVQQPANKHHTGNESGGDVTPTSTKRNSGAGVVKTCDHCKRPFVAKRPKRARYCGPGCRRAAWMEANPDKAQAIAARDKARLKAHIIANGGAWEDRQAGGGAVGVFIALALLALAIWFVWPTLTAARQAVNRQPVGIEARGVIFEEVGQPYQVQQVATAVPQTLPQAAPQLPQVAATAVPPRVDVAATAGAAMLHITANGREYNLTGEKLVDCANAQQNGQRTGPGCPPNAAGYLGMLGQGR